MLRVRNIQLSVFCNKYVDPNPQNIASLMGIINMNKSIEFLPNIYTTPKFDFLSNRTQIISNLSFITKSQLQRILFSNERIDVSFLEDLNNLKIDVEEDSQLMTEILSAIMRNQNIIGHRLAMNVDYSFTDSVLSSDYKKYIEASFPFAENKEIKEYSFRLNVADCVTISGRDEMLNVITSVSKDHDIKNNKDYLTCHSDINTIYENQEIRFNYEDIASFRKETIAIFKKISSIIEGMIFNGK